MGVRLALLGDSKRGDGRKGTGLREDGLPDIDWCRVDGGEVTIEIRANPDDPNSQVVNTLTRRVDRFWIARYPVTIAQFQAFVEACYADGRWRDTFLSEAKHYPLPKHRARYPNHPADAVNWWDAAAFCDWLSEALGYEVRLPNEFEWQQAATGGEESRTYPWGPQWDPAEEPWCANTNESELGRSTAVGMYPAGASPAGALDMAGTVWEWCRNAFEAPDVEEFPSAQEHRRVLRGGSWSFNLGFARCTFRGRLVPLGRYDNIGFRVLSSSPILDP